MFELLKSMLTLEWSYVERQEAKFLSRLCGLKSGVEAVITNGRVLFLNSLKGLS